MKKVFVMASFLMQVYLPLMAISSFGNGHFSKKKWGVSVADSIALNNAYFMVSHNAAVCTASHTAGIGSRVIVALNKVKIKSSRGSIRLHRGEIAVFQESESYVLPKGEFFEVCFKKNHPALTKPEQWVEPLKNTTVYEDSVFRVFEERLAPGDVRQLHSHAQRLVVRLNEVQLTDPRFYPNGKAGEGIQVANTVKFAEPMVHVVRNLGKIPLFNIVIEFKLSN